MSFFASEYHEAREKFLVDAEAYGLRNTRYRIPHEASSELFLDFAFVKRNSRRLLVHISGTHGVEGYVGSAVQRAILAEPSPASDASLLFVHALNPYGMAFCRRANGNNVDLNRNFTAQPLGNEDYAYFDSYLNPKSQLEFFTGLVRGFVQYKRLGLARSAQAIASGQPGWPRGLFYMGRGVQREIQLVQEILRSHFSEVEEGFVIDVHSGLGEWKDEMLFADEDVDPAASEIFPLLFGRALNRPDPAQGSYINQGRISGAFRAALPKARLHCLIQEFGTYPFAKVLNGLRRENFEWHANGAVGGASPASQARMLELFCPADEDWRKNVVELGVRRWRECLEYFRGQTL